MKARTREEQAVEDQFRTSLQQESDIRLRMERIESDGEIKKGVSRDEEGVKLGTCVDVCSCLGSRIRYSCLAYPLSTRKWIYMD